MGYTLEQVTAVIEAADRPLTAAAIADACYAASSGRTARGYGMAGEVNPALKRLQADGVAVSAKWGEEDNPHVGIAYVKADKGQRFWARVELAKRWPGIMVDRVARLSALNTLADQLAEEWPGPGVLHVRVQYDTRDDRLTWSIGGRPDQLEAIACALRAHWSADTP